MCQIICSAVSNGDRATVGLLTALASKCECKDGQARTIRNWRDHALTQEGDTTKLLDGVKSIKNDLEVVAPSK